MGYGRIEESPCSKCSIRTMRDYGCCVGDDIPDGLPLKVIKNQKGNTLPACYYLEVESEGNRCMNPDPPEDCLSFNCGR